MTKADSDKLASYRLRISPHFGKPLSEVPLSFLEWMVSDKFRGLSRMDRDVIEKYIALERANG